MPRKRSFSVETDFANDQGPLLTLAIHKLCDGSNRTGAIGVEAKLMQALDQFGIAHNRVHFLINPAHNVGGGSARRGQYEPANKYARVSFSAINRLRMSGPDPAAIGLTILTGCVGQESQQGNCPRVQRGQLRNIRVQSKLLS